RSVLPQRVRWRRGISNRNCVACLTMGFRRRRLVSLRAHMFWCRATGDAVRLFACDVPGQAIRNAADGTKRWKCPPAVTVDLQKLEALVNLIGRPAPVLPLHRQRRARRILSGA